MDHKKEMRPGEDCVPGPDAALPPKNVNNRSSFASIREADTALTQAFTTSKVSAYVSPPEEPAADNSSSSSSSNKPPSLGSMVQQADFFPPVTRPDSRLHGNWFPSDHFKGWKQINVKGRHASRSFSDLASLSLTWDAAARRRPSQQEDNKLPGNAPIERLPLEIQSNIIGHLVIDIPPNSLTKRNIDLMSLLCTSKKMHAATLVTLYRQITIPHSVIFKKFLHHVEGHPALGTLVRRFDFCHFNPGHTFSTASERSRAQNLTATTLLRALELTPYLQEFLAQEHIDGDLDAAVLRKLFFGLERVTALDFCGCSSAAFKTAFVDAFSQEDQTAQSLGLKRLSLHKCTTLPSSVFEKLLPRLPLITHLDLAGTRLTDSTLMSLPSTARLTHLNLAKCNSLTANGIIHFLTTHPAVAASAASATPSPLIWLSLAADASTHETFSEADVTRLLPVLPASLKALSLKGCKMNTSHIPLLLPLTKHLEELALGRGLDITDTNAFFSPPPPPPPQDDQGETYQQQYQQVEEQWQPPTLHFLDLSDLWSTEFDIPALYDTTRCALLRGGNASSSSLSLSLEVIEVAVHVAKHLKDAPLQRLGWHHSEVGSRNWIVRNGCAPAPRAWKMGAESWGMRKIPVARADVGGMYGSYMFARRL